MTARTGHGLGRKVAALAIAIAAAVAMTSGCSSDDTPAATTATGSTASSATTASRTSACRPVPAPGAPLDWVPSDLPLPPGSYPIAEDDSASGSSAAPSSDTHRGFLAVHASVTEFSSFIATEWTGRGWTLGKGDSERGEAEGGYRRGDFGGVFRVRDVYCDPSFTELLLVYGPGAPQ